MGDDTNAGTVKSAPKATLAAAIDTAVTEGKPVYACAETFAEAITVPAGVTLYGGLDCGNGWAYAGSTTKTTLAPAADQIPVTLANGAEVTKIEDVIARAADATAPGGSSIAAIVDGTTAELNRCSFVAGAGVAGENGESFAVDPALNGTPGNAGANACAGDPMNGNPGGMSASKTCDGGDVTAGGKGGDGGRVDPGPPLTPLAGGNGEDGQLAATGGKGGGGEPDMGAWDCSVGSGQAGPPGEEIYCDEFGRVRVHFHWDRESRMNNESSCWIHVSQSWGGAGYGAMNLPRVGQEVLVGFLGGDPDRPVIVGRVYTNLQKVPYPLPQHKTQSGWKSQSSLGGGGFNEIRFEDAKGREQVYIQAERDLKRLVRNNEDVTIGNNSTKAVRNHQREVTGQTRNVVVGTNRSTQIGCIDSTIVGEMCSVMVSPPGEGGLEDATAWTMQKDKITFSTPGGAKITLEGGTIRLEAPDMIYAYGNASCTLWSFGPTTIGGVAGVTVASSEGNATVRAASGDVVIQGGPLVKIN